MSEHRLSEIVIERPREGMRISLKKMTGYKKALQKITDEAAEEGLLSPYFIKTRKRTKRFSDHLGPLYRWLCSKVGKPWNETYSELCDRLDTSTLTGQHILSHLWDYVERNRVLIDEAIAQTEPQIGPPFGSGYSKSNFYVHPETGILCVLPNKWTTRETYQKPDDSLSVDYYHEYRKIDGFWYFITFESVPEGVTVRDLLRKVKIKRQMPVEYPWELYAARKRQCNKKEIKWILEKLSKN